MASVEVNQMLAAAAAACEDKKAEDVRILALDPAESGLADYFLICTGTNDRQTVAITDEIELRLKRDFSTYPNSVEGRRQGEWILMDYVDFIVHVFLPEKRAFYGLERLRKTATTLSLDELDSEIKSAIEAKRPAAGKAARKTASAKSSDGAPVKAAKKAAGKKTATKKVSGKKVAANKTAKKAAAKRSVKRAVSGE
jgi:ribosome-associated protein